MIELELCRPAAAACHCMCHCAVSHTVRRPKPVEILLSNHQATNLNDFTNAGGHHGTIP